MPSWRSIEIGNSSSRARKLRDKIEEVAAGEQMAADAGGGGRLDVALAIADQERLRRIDRPFGQQFPDHAGRGLAQVGNALVALDGAFRMEGAVFDAVDMGAMIAQLGAHPAMQAVDMLLAVKPARDARLVGD